MVGCCWYMQLRKPWVTAQAATWPHLTGHSCASMYGQITLNERYACTWCVCVCMWVFGVEKGGQEKVGASKGGQAQRGRVWFRPSVTQQQRSQQQQQQQCVLLGGDTGRGERGSSLSSGRERITRTKSASLGRCTHVRATRWRQQGVRQHQAAASYTKSADTSRVTKACTMPHWPKK